MFADLALVLREKCFLDHQTPLIVGVSGGADSLFLLHALKQLGYQPIVAHLNHGLRPEAEMEARQVERLATDLELPVVVDQVDVAAYARQENLSIEEAARNLRYRFLFSHAIRHAAQAVAVGHTADDQVETVLMHLLRGAGLDGLKGMSYRALPNPWSETIPLVRPLLGIWREQIEAYLAELGYQPILDLSNLDTTYYRNRLRHELIPYLESISPSVRRRIWQTAELLRDEHALVEDLLASAWQGCCLLQDPEYVALSYSCLKGQPRALQRRIFRRAMDQLRPGLRDIDFELIERALAFVQAPPASGQADLAVGLRLLLEGDRLWLASWEAHLPTDEWPQLPSAAMLELEVPGSLTLPAGWQLEACIESLPSANVDHCLNHPSPYQAVFDPLDLRLPLYLRPRRPGDRIVPLGMSGKMVKISDVMINAKVPRRARQAWPLVCARSLQDGEEQLLWVPGLRQSHAHRLTPSSSKALILRLVKGRGML